MLGFGRAHKNEPQAAQPHALNHNNMNAMEFYLRASRPTWQDRGGGRRPRAALAERPHPFEPPATIVEVAPPAILPPQPPAPPPPAQSPGARPQPRAASLLNGVRRRHSRVPQNPPKRTNRCRCTGRHLPPKHGGR